MNNPLRQPLRPVQLQIRQFVFYLPRQAGRNLIHARSDARELVTGANSLAELAMTLAGFEGCGLKATAKNTCFYRGAEQAPLMR